MSSTLKIDLRRERIMQQLRAQGRVSVAQLSQELQTTPVTIRNDLTAMERDGYLMRVQGGAVLPAVPAQSYTTDTVSNLQEKNAIAQAVSKQVRNGQTLFINSGTTTLCVADALQSKRDINVVTNSLAVATRLGGIPSIRVVLLGGEINAQYGFTYGGDTQEQLSRYTADWVILSMEGVGPDGITTRHAEEAIIDRTMIGGAKQVLIAADHTKLGHVGFARVSPWESRFTLVTDDENNSPVLAALENGGMQIIRA